MADGSIPSPQTAIHLTDQLPFITTRLEGVSAQGRTINGTGFFVDLFNDGERHVPAIVTNRHVAESIVHGVFLLNKRNESRQGCVEGKIPVSFNRNAWIYHPNPKIDLAALPIATALNDLSLKKNHPYYRMVTREFIADSDFLKDISVTDRIIMIGYPNGLWDSHNNHPIIRRGIISTPPHADFEGRPEFVIDCACYAGSSGSPIFVFDNGMYADKSGGAFVGSRFKLIGILWGAPQYTSIGEIKIVNIPTENKPTAVSTHPLNLGFCIKSTELNAFEQICRQKLSAEDEVEPISAA